MKKLFKVIIPFIIFINVLSYFNVEQSNAATNPASKTKDFQFAQSTSQNQTQTINIPNLTKVNNITVDNGKVQWTVDGENIKLNLTGGTGKQVQTGGTYIPADTKFVTDQTSASYNKDGYSGTLTGYVISGSYTPSDTKWVTNQTSPNYNSGGYSGTLSSYVYSGSYTPGSCKTASSSTTIDPRKGESLPGSMYYNDGTYSGTLSYTGSGSNGVYVTGYYSGTVCSSGTDTRVWRYEGYVTKPAVDTRVWRYEGNVTKPAQDTRTYTTMYSYSVTVDYEDIVYNPPNLDPNSGLDFSGTQFYRIPTIQPYLVNNFTWGIMVKPKSLQQETLVSNSTISSKDISIKIEGDSKVHAYVSINGTSFDAMFDGSLLTLNGWNYIGLTYDGQNVKLYLNGKLMDSVAATGSVSYSGTDLYIGANPTSTGGTTKPFIGKIDNVRIWNRALDYTELMDATAGKYPGSGLIGCWVFDKLTTGISFDKSSNRNDATGYNFSSDMTLTASNIDDLGMTLNWGSISNATGYRLERNGQTIYQGNNLNYFDDALISDTDYNYSVIPIGVNGTGSPGKQTFRTAVGSLQIISAPKDIVLSPLTLDGNIQKSYGTFNEKIIVKDTRKIRSGWMLQVGSTNFTSSDQKRKFPINSINMKPALNIVQTRGLKGNLPRIISTTQSIDKGSPVTVVNSDATNLGYGIYEITLPTNTLEINLNPSYGYVNADGSPLTYSTDLTWTIIPS